MRYRELGLYIDALKRSGNDTNKLQVDRALKLAIPVTCLIVALLGAPLAITTPRSGAAAGIGLSLATTIVFLLLTQLARAVGAGGVVNPVVAAWLPNALFLLAALVLLDRVRT
jgi:lipopolysaccharide export system permease protein